MVQFLLKHGADPYCQDKPRGYNCLQLAVYHRQLSVLRVLIAPTTTVEYNGRIVPLTTAKVQYTGGTCRFIDSRAAIGMTAMHLSALTGQAEAATLLLQRNASMAVRTVGQDTVDGVNITLGATPLHLAAKCGSMATLQAMLQVCCCCCGGGGSVGCLMRDDGHHGNTTHTHTPHRHMWMDWEPHRPNAANGE